MRRCDVVVVGAGPGGYVAAIRGAQLGLKVALVERERPGGICLNWGCIPSKNLIAQAERMHGLAELESLGLRVDRGSLDYAKVQERSRAAADTLAAGVTALLRRHRIELVKGEAQLTGPHEVALRDGTKLQASAIVVATGSRPLRMPGFDIDEQQVLSSTGLLAMRSLPKSMLILGAGAIGCEFAHVMHAFGVKVTLLEAAPQLLPGEDSDCAAALAESFARRGIALRLGTRAVALERRVGEVRVSLEEGSELRAERALVVLGRRPNSDGLGLEALGIQPDRRGFIPVGEHQRTAVPSVFAIGDVTATPALAHVASREGIIAMECIAGRPGASARVDPERVPSAVYCEPQVAGFGRRDGATADEGSVRSFRFPFRALGKAVAMDRVDGLLKVIADTRSGEILGAHAVGHQATEIVHELLLAANGELLIEDIAAQIHAHPTISESIHEAAHGWLGQAIHV